MFTTAARPSDRKRCSRRSPGKSFIRSGSRLWPRYSQQPPVDVSTGKGMGGAVEESAQTDTETVQIGSRVVFGGAWIASTTPAAVHPPTCRRPWGNDETVFTEQESGCWACKHVGYQYVLRLKYKAFHKLVNNKTQFGSGHICIHAQACQLLCFWLQDASRGRHTLSSSTVLHR